MANGLYNKYMQKAINPQANLFVSDATNATPIVVQTTQNHWLADADQVAIIGVLGNLAANGTFFIKKTAVGDATHFGLYSDVGLTTPVAGTGAYTSGGNVLLSDLLLKKIPYIVRYGVGSSGDTYGDDIKGVMVNTTAADGAGNFYTADLHQDEFLSDIPVGARISTGPALLNKTDHTGAGVTFVGGIADADDFVFTAVGPVGKTIEVIVFYKDTGDPTSSPLILYDDTAQGSELPVTANGGDIQIAVDSGTNRLFAL